MKVEPLGWVILRRGERCRGEPEEDLGEELHPEQTKANGFPKRMHDLALLVKWNRGMPSGPARLLAPVFGWLARRAESSGRAAELLRRYGAEDPLMVSGPTPVAPRHAVPGSA
jgi:hypothetical protein